MDLAIRHTSLPQLRDLQERIVELHGAKRGYAEIIERASGLLECPLSIWDGRGAVIAAAATQHALMALLERANVRLRVAACGRRHAVRLPLYDLASTSVVALAVDDGCDAENVLVFVPKDEEVAFERCEAVAPDLGNIIAGEARRLRAMATSADGPRRCFERNLLDSVEIDGSTCEGLRERGRTLGYELADAYWVFMAEVIEPAASAATGELPRILGTRIARGDRRAFTVEEAGRVIVLIPAAKLERDRFARLRDTVVSVIHAVIKEYGARFHAGLSESSVPLDKLASEVTSIRRSLDLNRCLGFRQEFVSEKSIHPYRLLMASADRSELLHYWTETIRPLYDYDELHETTFIDSLATFFACNHNAIEAARGLYVHRNTMARRLRRIEDVLHVDLANAETAFRLQLALRVHHIVISSGMHIDNERLPLDGESRYVQFARKPVG